MKRTQLIEKRKEADLTLRDLGKKIGYSYNYLNQVENGHRDPSIELALKLEEALGIPARYLLESKLKKYDRVLNGGRSA